MMASPRARRYGFALVLALLAAAVVWWVQPAQDGFEPQLGQAGKDVLWVPTSWAEVNIMLNLADVNANDYVIDLGSGDGRTVVAAAKRGARALGIEFDPNMNELATRNARQQGVADKARFIKADFFEYDLSQATVITMFLLEDLNLKLRPRLLELKPGTRIVSNRWTLGEWEPDDRARMVRNWQSGYWEEDSSTRGSTLRNYYRAVRGTVANGYRAVRYAIVPPTEAELAPIRLWIVPAKAAGAWQWAQGELVLAQTYQKVSGTLRMDGRELAIENGRLRGNELSFSAGGAAYIGRINGDRIDVSVKGGGSAASWSASRQVAAADKPPAAQ